MYLPDLAPHRRIYGWEEPNTFSVGWLSGDHRFPTGAVSPQLLEKLLAVCVLDRRDWTAGYHSSPFLKDAPFGFPVEFQRKTYHLGAGEIRVRGPSGRRYAAPDLIYHYVRDCAYLPPQGFLDALEHQSLMVVRARGTLLALNRVLWSRGLKLSRRPPP